MACYLLVHWMVYCIVLRGLETHRIFFSPLSCLVINLKMRYWLIRVIFNRYFEYRTIMFVIAQYIQVSVRPDLKICDYSKIFTENYAACFLIVICYFIGQRTCKN